MKLAFSQMLNFEEPLHLLRRKAEMLCKLHKRAQSFPELLQQLLGLIIQEPDSEVESIIRGKVVAMYMFDLLSEFHMTQKQMKSSHADFMQVFSAALQDKQTRVRTATFKAMTKHLTMLEDEELVMKFAQNMSNLLDIVVEVIKADEDQGKQSL